MGPSYSATGTPKISNFWGEYEGGKGYESEADNFLPILKFYAKQKMQSYEIVVVVYFVAVHVDF